MEQPTIDTLISKYHEVIATKSAFSEKLELAVSYLHKAFDDYGINSVAISYNGGKDSDACAQLWRIALYLYLEKIGKVEDYQTTVKNSIFIVFHSPYDFKEIDDHVDYVTKSINIKTVNSTESFKEGLIHILDQYHSKAIVLGVRRTDPQGKTLNPLTPSTPDYPPFMRVLPVLDWTYGDIWDFIFTFSIPYCCMYKDGYTSIGTSKNTFQNESLLKEDGTYGHASELQDWTLERGIRKY